MRAAVCGVICEYDPFHNGHAHQLRLARERTGADHLVCVMSGSFTQRGTPALLSPFARAQMALENGADAVLALPVMFSVREADAFALGGVSILNALGCVTHLSFGCEEAALPYIESAAEVLENGSAKARTRELIEQGLSPAAAQGRAVAETLRIAPETLHAPNAALAVSYLRAIRRLNAPIKAVPVVRQGDYHAAETGAGFPAASALRGAILRGDWQSVRAGMPESAYAVLTREVREKRVCPPDRLDLPVRCALLTRPEEAWRNVPGIGEGLEQRLFEAAKNGCTREEILSLASSRRYTRGRLSRALCWGVLGAEKSDFPLTPCCARLLGFRESARPLLHAMRDSGFPLYTRAANVPDARWDTLADEMWAVLAGLPRGETYRMPPVRISSALP